MKALSLSGVKVTQNGIKSVADPHTPPPPLFLDKTEAQRAEGKFFGLLSQGLDLALKMSLQ